MFPHNSAYDLISCVFKGPKLLQTPFWVSLCLSSMECPNAWQGNEQSQHEKIHLIHGSVRKTALTDILNSNRWSESICFLFNRHQTVLERASSSLTHIGRRKALLLFDGGEALMVVGWCFWTLKITTLLWKSNYIKCYLPVCEGLNRSPWSSLWSRFRAIFWVAEGQSILRECEGFLLRLIFQAVWKHIKRWGMGDARREEKKGGG